MPSNLELTYNFFLIRIDHFLILADSRTTFLNLERNVGEKVIPAVCW